MSSLNSISNISVIPDRIEAGTFLIAAAAVGGKVEVTNIIPEHLESVIKCLKKANIQLEVKDSSIVLSQIRIIYYPQILRPMNIQVFQPTYKLNG